MDRRAALPVSDNDERGSLTQRAALASVSMALFLIGLKIWAVWQTHSVAMLGSLADTGLDLVASLVTLFSVRLAAQPADFNHRYGHGKAEALAALFQSILISGSALAIAWRGIASLGAPATPANPEYGIGVSLVAIAATALLVFYQRRVVARTGSTAIHADNVHYSSDLLLNSAVIAALLLETRAGLRGADPVFGILIALWLLWQVRGIASRSINELMDKEWPTEKRTRFLEVANAHPALSNIHDLRTRTSGARDFAQLHAWVAPEMTIAEAHRVMDEVEAKLEREFPGTEVIIHPEPTGYLAGHANPHERPGAE